MTATMTEMNLIDYGFEELSEDELQAVDGGDALGDFMMALNFAVRNGYPGGWFGVAKDARAMYNYYIAPKVPFLPYI
ncbi:MAG: bacteriocin [Oscillospiraceae bacterium]|jgi:bacteriocin-like protein|nr:bacteriocin [Oscillospiraceae bacterium]